MGNKPNRSSTSPQPKDGPLGGLLPQTEGTFELDRQPATHPASSPDIVFGGVRLRTAYGAHYRIHCVRCGDSEIKHRHRERN